MKKKKKNHEPIEDNLPPFHMPHPFDLLECIASIYYIHIHNIVPTSWSDFICRLLCTNFDSLNVVTIASGFQPPNNNQTASIYQPLLVSSFLKMDDLFSGRRSADLICSCSCQKKGWMQSTKDGIHLRRPALLGAYLTHVTQLSGDR